MRGKAGVVGVIAFVTALVMAVAVSAAPQKKSAGIVIGNIPPVIANPTIKAMDQGIKNQAKKLGMSAITIGGEFDPQAQIVAMDAAIQKKVSAISIWPLDPKGIAPSFEKAKAAGIPVFTIWSRGVPNVTANFQYDDYETAVAIAKMAAAELKKQGKECKVGIIEGIPVVTILKTRNDGLAAGAKAAGCTILEHTVNTKDNSDGAQPIASAWKAKYGSKMTAVLAYNDPSAMGALATVGGDFNPLITGFNGDSIAVDALKAKRLFASAAAPNVEIGNTIAWAINQMLVKKAKVPNGLPVQVRDPHPDEHRQVHLLRDAEQVRRDDRQGDEEGQARLRHDLPGLRGEAQVGRAVTDGSGRGAPRGAASLSEAASSGTRSGLNHMLEAKQVSKSFGVTRALIEVDFAVGPGEIVALAGENGSGKSTLSKIIAGALSPDSGTITIDEVEQHFARPRDALDRGIALVAQEPTACPDMSIAENILLTRLPRPLSPFSRQALQRLARPILETVEVDVDPGASFSSLKAGDRELVEIGKALASEPRYVILDEATSRLGEADVARLFRLLRRLRDQGTSFILITHRLPEMVELADRAIVLRDGRRVGELPRARTRRGEDRLDDGRPRADRLLPQAVGGDRAARARGERASRRRCPGADQLRRPCRRDRRARRPRRRRPDRGARDDRGRPPAPRRRPFSSTA